MMLKIQVVCTGVYVHMVSVQDQITLLGNNNIFAKQLLINPLTPGSETDITLSNARQFYWSTGSILGHLRC